MELVKRNLKSFFNPIQTQCFHTLYHTDKNVLIGAPTGSGKTIMAQIALMRMLQIGNVNSKCVFIAPMKALVREHLREFKNRFRDIGLGIVEVTGDSSKSEGSIKNSKLIITTPEKWDSITRNRPEMIYQTALLVIDEVHLLGEERGAVLESIVARIKFHKDAATRIICIYH